MHWKWPVFLHSTPNLLPCICNQTKKKCQCENLNHLKQFPYNMLTFFVWQKNKVSLNEKILLKYFFIFQTSCNIIWILFDCIYFNWHLLIYLIYWCIFITLQYTNFVLRNSIANCDISHHGDLIFRIDSSFEILLFS